MLGNDAMGFLKTLHNLDEIWKQQNDAEYNERQLTQFAERYHEHKLKLLGIGDVSNSVICCPQCGNERLESTGGGWYICGDRSCDWGDKL